LSQQGLFFYYVIKILPLAVTKINIMKQIFLAAFAGLLCMFTSCSGNTEASSDNMNTQQEQQNLAASDVINRAFETGDVNGIDSVVADDFLDHTDRGDMKGRDSLKAMVKMIHANFKDMKMEKVREVADEDFVYSWMRYSGTSDGTMGMPKGPYDMKAIEVSRYKDGKVVEHWSFMDMQDMMKMMPQPNMNSMDTTKMKK
jgi:predicted SnoaL-like aldol condensation-catalyzing enzyme